ncbi:hypothetical protein [Streptomyces beihaiensis]|uniref:Uncharacterized protein n=1 Tax=Streptomyces beihaiensis TaxID=2984495 RepID=A0ABT3TWZ2_9ACTN|nr:hypothetical protein [Streptomyces beihaiensis]MCX3061562.1 hypothetical protein [Streptomyces beihaiensis]
MEASGSLQIEQIVESSAERIVCIVRCVGGSVRPGDSVSGDANEESAHAAARAHVEGIWFPGRRIDLLDPPHAAKVEILGEDCTALRSASRIYTFPGSAQ